MIEVNAKDIFNVGYILLISGVIAVVGIQLVFPSDMISQPQIAIAQQQLAGLLIMIYASIKFYKKGREGKIDYATR
jgi:hypothetical protein